MWCSQSRPGCARAGGDVQAEWRLQTLLGFLRFPGGSGRCSQTQPMKHGAQAGSPKLCQHRDHKGLMMINGTVFQEDHVPFGVVGVKHCRTVLHLLRGLAGSRCKSHGLSWHTSSPSHKGSAGSCLPLLLQSQLCHPVALCLSTPDGRSFPAAHFPRVPIHLSSLPLSLRVVTFIPTVLVETPCCSDVQHLCSRTASPQGF